MKQGLNLGVRQSLTMTPALQQAIRMLQLSTHELTTEIQNALESNVMLEADEGPDGAEADNTTASTESHESEAAGDQLTVDTDWDQLYAQAPSAPATDSEPPGDWQANIAHTPDLHAHLEWQADMAAFTTAERAVAAVIIDAVGSNGLLEDWPPLASQIATDFRIDETAVARVLDVIHEFDPPGVGARGVTECIALQLRQYDDDTPGREAALALIDHINLGELVDPDPATLATAIDVDPETIVDALSLIQQCQPYPGDAFGNAESEYVVPEVSVARTARGWQVFLNNEIAPRVRINEKYLDLIKRGDRSEEQTTLKAHLQEARFFLNSLKSRNQTLLEVSECIVRAQRTFLEYGEKALKPMVLRDIAEQLGIHESTVSRATAHKYIQTPRGIIELKYFFSSSVPTADGGSISATAIQAMIRSMVAAELPIQPLSDSKLAEQLHTDGVRVARRTVAKYREALGIAPSRDRRRRAS